MYSVTRIHIKVSYISFTIIYLNGILIGNIHIGILDHFHDNPEGFGNIGGSLLLISCVRLRVVLIATLT